MEKFPAGTASFLTASEFHRSFKAGISVSDFSASGIVIGQTRIAAAGITGVITTIPCFIPQEFYYIEPADRNYVCAETNAFFIYFLSQLNCRKINPPSMRTLTGLPLHRIEWMRLISRLDIPLWPCELKNGWPVQREMKQDLQYLKATIIGDAVIGDKLPAGIKRTMHLLARFFSLPYLTGHFISPDGTAYFLAELLSIPDISTAAAQRGIVDYFQKSA